MRTRVLALGAVLLVASTVAFVFAAPGGSAPTPEIGMIIGEVIDIGSYAMKGQRGEENAKAGQFRSNLGFPIGILEEETNRVYIALYRLPVPAAGLQTANTVLAPYMGKKVVAQGLKYEAEGINVIRMSLVTEY